MDSKTKYIDAALLRRKIHEQITRTARQPEGDLYTNGFRDALAKVEQLIDKLVKHGGVTI